MLKKIFNKLRSICVLLILVFEFILSGLRIILFSFHEINDFELITDINKDALAEAKQNLSLINKLEQNVYPGASEIYINENDSDEDFI